MTLVSIFHKRIPVQFLGEIRIQVEQPDITQLKRIYLVDEFPVHISGITERCGEHISCIFRTALVIECKAEFRSRHRGTLETVVAESEEFRETQADAGADFIGMHIVIESELEIAVETDIEPFSATEQILVIDCELGGDSHQSCGIGGYLEICLEALQLGIRKGNIAIQHIIGHLLAVYVHSVEDLKG